MTTNLESDASTQETEAQRHPRSWLKMGVIAAGSALAGGLAAAWYYRNTLTKLRQAEAEMQNSESGSLVEPPDSEI